MAKKPGKAWNNLEFDNLGKKTWNFLQKSWKNLEFGTKVMENLEFCTKIMVKPGFFFSYFNSNSGNPVSVKFFSSKRENKNDISCGNNVSG